MKKIPVLMTIIFIAGLTSSSVAAKNEIPPGGPDMMASPSPVGKAVQNTNQVTTKNQGEDTQLKVSNQEQESLGSSESAQGAAKPESPRSDSAQEHMSVVAQTVQALLMNKTMTGGVGDQIREIAKTQQQAQEQIRTELNAVGQRTGFLKTLVGPDFKALKTLTQQMEQNRMRIEQLQKLMNQLTNQGDIQQVSETIQALTQQNTALQNQVTLEEQVGSIFGWLFKLFI